jgi:dolichol-phosphate mannosyltransferase
MSSRPPADIESGGAPVAAAESPPGALTAAAAAAWELARRVHLASRRPENWVELFKFGVVGATGYVINLLAFAGLVKGLDVHHIAAAVGAFCVAVTNNFVLNRGWTFRATEGHAGFQAARFLAVSVAALGINLVVLYLLADVLGMSELAAQAIAVATAMPFNFAGNKLWTFR